MVQNVLILSDSVDAIEEVKEEYFCAVKQGIVEHKALHDNQVRISMERLNLPLPVRTEPPQYVATCHDVESWLRAGLDMQCKLISVLLMHEMH